MKLTLAFCAVLLLVTPALVEGGQAGRWKSKKKKKASIEVGADGSMNPAKRAEQQAKDDAATIAKLKKDGYDVEDAAADHTQKGIELDGKGDRAGSLMAFGAAVKHNENPTTFMNFGVALMRSQRLHEARVQLDKAVELAPDDENLQANVKALEGAEKEMGIKTGPPPSATKKSKKYQRPGGKKNKYQRPGGKGKKNKYQRPGKKGGASGPPSLKAKIEDGYDIKDKDADHTQFAIKFDGQGRKEESIAAFGAAVKFHPEVVSFQMNYAVALMRGRQYIEALKHMEEAVKLAPGEGQVKENMDALSQSISVDDGSEEALQLRKDHPGRFEKKAAKKAKRKKKYQ